MKNYKLSLLIALTSVGKPDPQDEQSHFLKEVTNGTNVKETGHAKMGCYEFFEENMRRARNCEHILDSRTRKGHKTPANLSRRLPALRREPSASV